MEIVLSECHAIGSPDVIFALCYIETMLSECSVIGSFTVFQNDLNQKGELYYAESRL